MDTPLAQLLLDRLANFVLGPLARAVRLVPDACSAQILADLTWSSLGCRPAAPGKSVRATPMTCVLAA